MKKAGLAVSVLVALVFFTAVQSEAARTMKGGGWGMMEGGYSMMFDATTIETIRGQVTAVDRFSPEKGMSAGIHITVRAEQGPVQVHLGPEWFLQNQEGELKKGDTVDVVGSRVLFQGKSVIIASEIKRGDKVLTLRDQSGVPYWAGWRKG